MGERTVVLDILGIRETIPHRYPFLFVDRVLESQDGERILSLKNVSANEEFFQGHFPGLPVMPGVLIVEAMVQSGSILAKRSSDGVEKGKGVCLSGIEQAKFKRQVVPGDTLLVEMKLTHRLKPLWAFEGTVTVDGNIVAQASISITEVA